jgi:adenine-specific DNA-methyltransferase
MAVSIAYMGTKRQLATAVSDVISGAQPGALFDVFSGMCSVGQQIAPSRQVWTNDVQKYAAEVGAALFTSAEASVESAFASSALLPRFEEKYLKLARRFKKSLLLEVDLAQTNTFSHFASAHSRLENALLADRPKRESRSHNLFVTTYSGTYFGVRQSIEIDAIHFAITEASEASIISADQKRWLLVALGKAILKLSNSTGHFAQFLKPKETSFKTFLRQRSRCVWSDWLAELSQMGSIGTREWRAKNKAFNNDSLELLTRIKRLKAHPGVIYADPPYTDDQYSRYYHVLETLLLYDYPKVTGAGLYRAGRFTTPFSKKSAAPAALEQLIKATAELGADLVLSYPTNGLVHEAGCSPRTLLKKYFSRVEIGHSQKHLHSTFGASKGNAQEAVIERIYLART